MKGYINRKYGCLFLVFLFIEIFIALFIKDSFIRPFFGDVLVIILIYCFIMIFLKREIKHLPIYIFIFSVLVEIGQYFKIVELLHLDSIPFFRILIGTTFDLNDIFAYLIGFLVIGYWHYKGRCIKKNSKR